MRRACSRMWGVLATLALIATGCGQDPFSPPSRSRPTPTSDVAGTSKAAYFVFVVPEAPTGELEAWEQRAQRQASLDKAIFRTMGPGPGESRAVQPDLVRKAVADGASALIVYPGDAPDLAPALADAEAKGVPVVLLGRSIPAPAGSKPFTLVDFAPFDESARKIVETTIEDAKKHGRTGGLTALLLVEKGADPTSARRVAALKAAADSGGFARVLTATFDPSKEEAAKLAVVEAVKANPDLAVVLADDSEALIGASKARKEFQGKPAFFVGGYMDFGLSENYQPPTRESCYVEGKYWELGDLAIKVATAKLRGESLEGLALKVPKFLKGQAVVGAEADMEMPRPATAEGGRADQVPRPEPGNNPKP